MFHKIGNCRVVKEIGSGGMAVVYKAVQEQLGRTVAIKMLKPNIVADPQFAKRFEREAHFLASLQHENILHVYDFIADHNTLSIVMEYVQGMDLYDLLERSVRLPVDVAAIIALQVARALDYAHFRGLIHRDIKPANIMISHQGEVKLMDFGIAREESVSDLTETGTGLGTPSYMSPEQILGDRLDFRTDIFSLGIVLYQMVTGRKPFVEDPTRSVMQKIRLDRYTSPRKLNPEVPRTLERVISRCLQKMPSNRYPTTQSLIDDLTEFVSSRLTMNYNGRMVLFLRDISVLTHEEAEEILGNTSPRDVKRGSIEKKTLKNIIWALGALSGVLALGMLVLQLSRSNQKVPTSAALAQSQQGSGGLQIVVKPWAHIYVDGEHLATTPRAQPLLLSPGKHIIKLTNPYFKEETREVQIRHGQTLPLVIELQTKR